MLPLFFQVVLLDSATTAGARLAIPSLATPLGGLAAGIVMSRWGKLVWLVRTGAFLMLFGNALVTALQFEDSRWKYLVYIFPANLGQGIIYPAILFTTLASFDHAGEQSAHVPVPRGSLTDDLIPDHAVSASTVYLVRSLGTVWGVAVTSAIVQTTLSVRLPEVLGDIPDKEKVSILTAPWITCISCSFCSGADQNSAAHRRDSSLRDGSQDTPLRGAPACPSCILRGYKVRLRGVHGFRRDRSDCSNFREPAWSAQYSQIRAALVELSADCSLDIT